ncbi:MAG: GTP cyclohydrolase I FolE [Actinobacteria bacterium]|nr:GTP cyclohydrolase I FolE [Actinomycetota bacterium]
MDVDPRDHARHATDVDRSASFDHAKIEQAVRLILEAIGEDLDREGLVDTPSRVARELHELCAGLRSDPKDVLTVVFEEGHDEMVMVRDIPVYSLCEHHLLPFLGRAHVAYIPNLKGQITGVSKIVRLVDTVAKRPNIQERLTTTVAETLDEVLDPRGVLVVVEARHLCMEMRGVRKPGAELVTSAVLGSFRDDLRTRSEAMSFISAR